MMKTKTGVILAAGKGARLDRTDTIKPLLRVGNELLIIRNIRRMQDVGIEKIFVVTGYEGDLVKKELIANSAIKGKVEIVENPDWEKGMLTSLLAAKSYITGDLLLSACDLVFENNPYRSFSNEDMQFKGVVLLVQNSSDEFEASGARMKVAMTETGMNFGEELTDFKAIETGIYYFSEGILEDVSKISRDENLSELTSVLEILSNSNKVMLSELEGQQWFDINTPSTLIRAEMSIRNHSQSFDSHKILTNNLRDIEQLSSFVTKKEIETTVQVKVGCLKEIDRYKVIPDSHADSPHYIITDDIVDSLFGDEIHKMMLSAGHNIKKIVLPAGEGIKTLENYFSLCGEILSQGIDERSILISLGGGTVNNITGFVASTLYRGIYLIHIPTTLMAQCDAAIGAKQAVNSEKGKNLIGTYYEPLNIIVDPEILLYSDEKWLRDGLVECIKHAICQDTDFYDYIFNYTGELKDIEFLETVVKKNIELKLALMKDDPKEKDKALVLQYGHTIGHAVEYLSHYSLGHGESVGIGMRAAAEVSEVLGISSPELVKQHREILSKFGLPDTIPDYIHTADVIDTLRYNKRFLYGEVQLVLLERLGLLWNYKGDYSVPCDNNILAKAINNSYS